MAEVERIGAGGNVAAPALDDAFGRHDGRSTMTPQALPTGPARPRDHVRPAASSAIAMRHKAQTMRHATFDQRARLEALLLRHQALLARLVHDTGHAADDAK
jgi:hypothetical protein